MTSPVSSRHAEADRSADLQPDRNGLPKPPAEGLSASGGRAASRPQRKVGEPKAAANPRLFPAIAGSGGPGLVRRPMTLPSFDKGQCAAGKGPDGPLCRDCAAPPRIAQAPPRRLGPDSRKVTGASVRLAPPSPALAAGPAERLTTRTPDLSCFFARRFGFSGRGQSQRHTSRAGETLRARAKLRRRKALEKAFAGAFCIISAAAAALVLSGCEGLRRTLPWGTALSAAAGRARRPRHRAICSRRAPAPGPRWPGADRPLGR